MLFREIIAVYCENHKEHTNALCGQNIFYQYIYVPRMNKRLLIP
jgi:hypothetical protein